MNCGEIGSKRLLAASTLLGLGLALLYFTGGRGYPYQVPLLALAAPALLVIFLLLREKRLERRVALSILFASVTASLPLFYASAEILVDMMRSSGSVPPALSGLYGTFPGFFPYILALILFALYISAIALFKAFEDIFESLLYIERFTILRAIAPRRIGVMEALGIVAGAATSYVSLRMGYSAVILLPFLFFARIPVLLTAILTSLVVDFGHIDVNIYVAAVAVAVYYLVEYRLFSRYIGDAVAAVKRPMRMFYSSISLLIILMIFFAVFQEKAPLLSGLYIVALAPLIFAVSTLEIGALSLPLAAVLAISENTVLGVSALTGFIPGGLQLTTFMLASGILGIQFASYSTFFTSKEEFEECHIGILEASSALVTAVIATWYYGIHSPSIELPPASPGVVVPGILVPLVALAASVVHMIFFTPLVSEGAVALGLNFMNPLGVLAGAVFHSQIFAATAASAIVLKLVDTRVEGRIKGIMRGFIYGVGLGLALVSVIL